MTVPITNDPDTYVAFWRPAIWTLLILITVGLTTIGTLLWLILLELRGRG